MIKENGKNFLIRDGWEPGMRVECLDIGLASRYYSERWKLGMRVECLYNGFASRYYSEGETYTLEKSEHDPTRCCFMGKSNRLVKGTFGLFKLAGFSRKGFAKWIKEVEDA